MTITEVRTRSKGTRVAAQKMSSLEFLRVRLWSWFARKRQRWSAEREWRREMRAMRTGFHFEHDDIAAVAAVLETDWDDTGFRLVGVPRNDFVQYASRLVADIACGASDERIADRLTTFEAELGLRDSPLAHRLAIAARVRTAARHAS